MWRAVGVPTEHGGWGLTAEPVALGLVVAFSWGGFLIGMAALVAFVARTPLKLAWVDRRRGRSLERTRLAWRIGLVELLILAVLAAGALGLAGWTWLVPLAIAAPLFAIELWFDVRSRGRRLLPELCGAVGMAGIVAAVVIAGDGPVRLAAATWMILAARSLTALPFIHTQIERLRHGSADLRASDGFQALGVVTAAGAVAVDRSVLLGSLAVTVIAAAQFVWVRRTPIPPAKVNGVRQMFFGLAVVVATAIGVLVAAS